MKIVFKILGGLIFLMGVLALTQMFVTIMQGKPVYGLRGGIVVSFGMILPGMIAFFVMGKKKETK